MGWIKTHKVKFIKMTVIILVLLGMSLLAAKWINGLLEIKTNGKIESKQMVMPYRVICITPHRDINGRLSNIIDFELTDTNCDTPMILNYDNFTADVTSQDIKKDDICDITVTKYTLNGSGDILTILHNSKYQNESISSEKLNKLAINEIHEIYSSNNDRFIGLFVLMCFVGMIIFFVYLWKTNNN